MKIPKKEAPKIPDPKPGEITGGPKKPGGKLPPDKPKPKDAPPPKKPAPDQGHLFGPGDHVYNVLQCQIERVREEINRTVEGISKRQDHLVELDRELAGLEKAARETQALAKKSIELNEKGGKKEAATAPAKKTAEFKKEAKQDEKKKP